MDEFEKIEKALDDLGGETTMADGTTSSLADQITVMSTDPIETLRAQVAMLVSQNAAMKRRLDDLEGKVLPLLTSKVGNRKRTEAKLPVTDMYARLNLGTGSSRAISVGDDGDTSSMVSVSRPPSVTSTPGGNTREIINPFANMTTNMNQDYDMGRKVVKGNSAVSQYGYSNSKQVWGTALACMLIATTNFYIQKTNQEMLRVEEKIVVTNCIRTVSVLYTQALHRPLPDVKDHATSALAQLISKKDPVDIPVVDAKTWWAVGQNADGKDILRILDTVIRLMKMTPEIIAHPVSQVVGFMIPPMIRLAPPERGAYPIFAVSATANVSLLPNEWERWCSILKEDALTKYVKYRLSGMKEPQVVSKMVSEMKSSELTDKKI